MRRMTTKFLKEVVKMKKKKMITIPYKEYMLLRCYKFGYQLISLHAKVMRRFRQKQKRIAGAAKELFVYL